MAYGDDGCTMVVGARVEFIYSTLFDNFFFILPWRWEWKINVIESRRGSRNIENCKTVDTDVKKSVQGNGEVGGFGGDSVRHVASGHAFEEVEPEIVDGAERGLPEERVLRVAGGEARDEEGAASMEALTVAIVGSLERRTERE